VCARGNTRASLGVPGRRRAHAERGRGMACERFGRQARLGELGGGEWDLVAQWWTVASPRSFVATGVCPGHAGE
jgi:hypothetical protein